MQTYRTSLAETAPQLGLDLSSFKLAFVGALRAADILSFIVMICSNRGWQAEYFTDMEPAMKWLAADGSHSRHA